MEAIDADIVRMACPPTNEVHNADIVQIVCPPTNVVHLSPPIADTTVSENGNFFQSFHIAATKLSKTHLVLVDGSEQLLPVVNTPKQKGMEEDERIKKSVEALVECCFGPRATPYTKAKEFCDLAQQNYISYCNSTLRQFDEPYFKERFSKWLKNQIKFKQVPGGYAVVLEKQIITKTSIFVAFVHNTSFTTQGRVTWFMEFGFVDSEKTSETERKLHSVLFPQHSQYDPRPKRPKRAEVSTHRHATERENCCSCQQGCEFPLRSAQLAFVNNYAVQITTTDRSETVADQHGVARLCPAYLGVRVDLPFGSSGGENGQHVLVQLKEPFDRVTPIIGLPKVSIEDELGFFLFFLTHNIPNRILPNAYASFQFLLRNARVRSPSTTEAQFAKLFVDLFVLSSYTNRVLWWTVPPLFVAQNLAPCDYNNLWCISGKQLEAANLGVFFIYPLAVWCALRGNTSAPSGLNLFSGLPPCPAEFLCGWPLVMRMQGGKGETPASPAHLAQFAQEIHSFGTPTLGLSFHDSPGSRMIGIMIPMESHFSLTKEQLLETAKHLDDGTEDVVFSSLTPEQIKQAGMMNMFGECVYEVCLWDDSKEDWQLFATDEFDVGYVYSELLKRVPHGKHLIVRIVTRRIVGQLSHVIATHIPNWNRVTTGASPWVERATWPSIQQRILEHPQFAKVMEWCKKNHTKLIGGEFDSYSAQQAIIQACLVLKNHHALFDSDDDSDSEDDSNYNERFDVYPPPILMLEGSVIDRMQSLRQKNLVQDLMLQLRTSAGAVVSFYGMALDESVALECNDVFERWQKEETPQPHNKVHHQELQLMAVRQIQQQNQHKMAQKEQTAQARIAALEQRVTQQLAEMELQQKTIEDQQSSITKLQHANERLQGKLEILQQQLQPNTRGPSTERQQTKQMRTSLLLPQVKGMMQDSDVVSDSSLSLLPIGPKVAEFNSGDISGTKSSRQGELFCKDHMRLGWRSNHNQEFRGPDRFDPIKNPNQAISVTTIDLFDCCLQLEDITLISHHLLVVEMLTELDLGRCEIGDDGVIYFAEFLPVLKKLKTLNLWGNNITADGTQYLARVLVDLTQLEQLSLRENELYDTGIFALVKSLPALQSLKSLSLSSNKITERGMSQLAGALVNLTKLEDLMLNANYLGDAGVAHLCQSLPSLKLLKRLYLNQNKITETGARHLMSSLAQSQTALHVISLRGNQLFDSGILHVANSLRQQQQEQASLKELYLDDNHASKEAKMSVKFELMHVETVLA